MKTTMYATIRQVKTDPYSFVETIDRLFLEEHHAEDYANTHNEQHPQDFLVVKPYPIADQVDVFNYVQGTFAYTEERCLKEVFETRTGNSIDNPEHLFHAVSFRRSTFYPMGALRIGKTQNVSFEAERERSKKNAYHFTLQTKVKEGETTDQTMARLTEQANALQKKVMEYEKVGQFATDETLENWLNDPQFDLEALKNLLK